MGYESNWDLEIDRYKKGLDREKTSKRARTVLQDLGRYNPGRTTFGPCVTTFRAGHVDELDELYEEVAQMHRNSYETYNRSSRPLIISQAVRGNMGRLE